MSSRLWFALVAAVVAAILLLPAYAPEAYAEVLTTMLVLGFLASVYFLATWGVAALRSYRHGRLQATTLEVLDFVGFPIVSILVMGLNIYNVWLIGIDETIPASAMVQRLGQVLLIASIVLLRAGRWVYIWATVTDQTEAAVEFNRKDGHG